jgi:hypothetical protein
MQALTTSRRRRAVINAHRRFQSLFVPARRRGASTTAAWFRLPIAGPEARRVASRRRR